MSSLILEIEPGHSDDAQARDLFERLLRAGHARADRLFLALLLIQPVLALTVHVMKCDRERFLTSGFDAYLSKPIRAEELSRVLEKHADRTAAEATQAVGEQAWGQLLTICDGDSGFAGELAEVFLESAQRLVAGISGAIEAGDADRLASEAHGLRGISLTIGAAELVRTSRALEEAGRESDLAGAHAAAPECQAAWELLRVSLAGHARR